MIKEKQSPSTRTIERDLEINAPAEKVWKALTDAKELTRWFPLDAKVTPGKGGSIFYSWGPPYEGDSEIEIWEPNRHLKMTDRWSEHSHGDEIQEIAKGVPAQVSMDFELESHGGKTILKLVHSGFGASEDWEDEFDATSRGWTFELNNLKHYLENHEGAERHVVWARTLVMDTREAVWLRLMDAFLKEGSIENLKKGDPYSIKSAGGFELKGRVIANHPPLDFYGTVENFNNAIFCFRIEQGKACGVAKDADPEIVSKQVQPNLWLSLWNQPDHLRLFIQEAWTRFLTQTFP